MQVSDNGLEFIGKWEGFVDHIYKDIGGKPTIAFGHLIKPNEIFYAKISREDGVKLLRKDAAIAESIVNNNISIDINQNMFDACVSLSYNVGESAMKGSIGKLINANLFKHAATAFLLYCKYRKDTGELVINQGLLNRRKDEARLFLTPLNELSEEEKLEIEHHVQMSIDAILQDDLWHNE
jgi:lysozyme